MARHNVNMIENKKNKTKYVLTLLLFIVPAMFFYGIFNLFGIARTFYYSLMDWKGISTNMSFIGLDNYITVLKDGAFWNSVKNNLILVVVSVGIQIPGGLLLALLINVKNLKGMKFFRTVFFMPRLLSTVATGIMWILFYDPTFGLLAKIIKALDLNISTAFLQGKTALYAILFVVCWIYIPYYMIIIRAGLTNVSEDLYEASKIDGANGWQAFWAITMPLIKPTLRSAAVLSLVGSLKYFDLFYVMMGGAPNDNTELMATYMYKRGFTQFKMGYASTVAALMFLFSFIFTCVFLYSTRGKEEKKK